MMERTCRNCVHCLIETQECNEGGYTEIGDLDMVRSPEDCNAWKPREPVMNVVVMDEAGIRQSKMRVEQLHEFFHGIFGD